MDSINTKRTVLVDLFDGVLNACFLKVRFLLVNRCVKRLLVDGFGKIRILKSVRTVRAALRMRYVKEPC